MKIETKRGSVAAGRNERMRGRDNLGDKREKALPIVCNETGVT